MPRPYLRHCPFCGHDDIRLRNNSELWQGQELYKTIVFCDRCSAQVEKLSFPRDGQSPEAAEMEAVRIWNQRRDPEGYAKELRRKTAAAERKETERVERGNVKFRRVDASRRRGELWVTNTETE